MKYTSSALYKNWIYLISFASISILFISFLIYSLGINQSKSTAERFDTFVNEKMKNNVKTEVLNRIDEIEYDLKMIINDENLETKTKIIQLKELLLHSDVMEISDLEERRNAAILLLESIVASDPDYLYFVVDTRGSLLFSGTDSSLVGTDLTNAYVKDGISFVSELKKAVNISNGAHITYYWPKTKDGVPLKKTSFCLYIPEFDIIIGTGSYEEDVTIRLQEEIYSRIQSYYAKKENYMFIVSMDGILKSYPQNVGQSVYELDNPELVNAHTLILDQLENNDGFVTYDIKEKSTDYVSHKISYVHSIDGWNVYIGLGYYTNDTLIEISDYTTQYRDKQLGNILLVICLLMITLLGSLFLVRRGMKINSEITRQDDIVFEQLFDLVHEGIVIVSDKKKILYKNDIVTKIFKGQLDEIFSRDYKLKLKNLNDPIFSYEDKANREYFLNIRKSNVIFHNFESEIYMIRDISQSYIYENDLLRMAYYDPLTELPNRRKLINDYDDAKTNNTSLNGNNLIIAILDLDHFKNINDTYGHDTGDNVLVEFSKYIRLHIREEHSFYRYGGEEFIIIFTNLDLQKVAAKLTMINHSLSEHIIKTLGFPITFSAGAIEIQNDLESDIAKADKLLYQAKSKGRNRIEIILDVCP